MIANQKTLHKSSKTLKLTTIGHSIKALILERSGATMYRDSFYEKDNRMIFHYHYINIQLYAAAITNMVLSILEFTLT